MNASSFFTAGLKTMRFALKAKAKTADVVLVGAARSANATVQASKNSALCAKSFWAGMRAAREEAK